MPVASSEFMSVKEEVLITQSLGLDVPYLVIEVRRCLV